MRFGSGPATFIQLVVVALLSAASVYALSTCSLYLPVVSLVSRLYPISPLHFGLVLAGLFTLIGGNLALGGLPDRFMWLVVTLSLPSLYAYSYFKWFKFWGLDFRIETQLSFDQMLALQRSAFRHGDGLLAIGPIAVGPALARRKAEAAAATARHQHRGIIFR